MVSQPFGIRPSHKMLMLLEEHLGSSREVSTPNRVQNPICLHPKSAGGEA
jgi:hypothetical protein